MDMLVESTDVPRGMSFRQAARKALAMCDSDFAAKGVRPDSYMVSIGLSRGASSEQVRELALGLKDASCQWHLKLVGGDTNEANELVIDCAMVGFGKRQAGRGSAKSGDVVVTTGLFGYPPAGLRILRGARAGRAFKRAALESVLLPTPDLRLGLALGPFWTSVMDSSDGLGRSLHELSRTSGSGMAIDTLPVAKGLEEFAAANRLSARDLVLAGGEEYLLVGTMEEGRLAAAKRAARRCGGRLIEIGTVGGRRGVVTLRLGNRKEPIQDVGWIHLG